MKKRKYYLYGLVILVILISLMVIFEKASPDSSITGPQEAIWYALVTLTTVGYGDLYPVTVGGKIIGAIFVVCSLGLLTFLLSLFVNEFKGKMLPLCKLFFWKKRERYIFTDANEETIALAERLAKEGKDKVIVFAGELDNEELNDFLSEYSDRAVSTTLSLHLLVKKKRTWLRLFFLSDDYSLNEERAYSFKDSNAEVYCKTDREILGAWDRLHLFDPGEITARSYWRKHPIGIEETQVVIIGSGKKADSLLERALLTNVYGPNHKITYHVFGDFSKFESIHYELDKCVNVSHDGEIFSKDNDDSVVFYTGSWEKYPEIIKGAGRIILVDENEETNLDNLSNLKRYYVVSGKIYVNADVKCEGVSMFGKAKEIFTPENVMKNTLDMLAKTMNENYRQAEIAKGNTAPTWEELNSFTRLSNICAADHLYVKTRILLGTDKDYKGRFKDAYAVFEKLDEEKRMELREIEHIRWLRVHYLYNWRYSKVRNNDALEHPSMVPFSNLELSDKVKDDYAWILLKELA